MKTIYNAQGETKTCDAVDAREHIATGRWFSEAPVAAEAPADTSAAGDASPNAVDTSRMNKAELLAQLTAIGVEHSGSMTKAELKELLESATWKPGEAQ